MRPSFSSSRVTSTSAPSTTNALTPFAPSVERSVRAKTRNVPAWLPFVIHCLAPLSLQPSPSGTALVRSAPASDPEPGSVSANAPSTRPVASSGTNRRRCSSVPNERIGSVAALVCTATVTPTPASARDSSSSTRMYETKSAPAPPSSSGTHTPSRPSSPSFVNSGLGKVWSRSHEAACGTISASATSRASAWIARCSGVGEKSIGSRV